MPVLVEMWNDTPRPELGTRSPAAGSRATAGTKRVGRNEPWPCESGKKYKRCCLGRGVD